MILACVALILCAGGLLWCEAKPMLDRLLVVHERRYAPLVQPKSDPMPAALEQQAMGWADEQARDDTLTAMREAYAEVGDWSMVAARFADLFRARS